MTLWKKILIVGAMTLGYYQWSQGKWIELESPLSHAVPFGNDVPTVFQVPVQKQIHKDLSFRFQEFTIHPLASFQLTARVLASRHYRSGAESRLSPVDLALGWGLMSEDEILKDIDIRQSVRFYSWRVKELPIPKKQISSHSANMHLIPANREIDERIRDAGEGDVVSFRGYLVRINGENGWSWTSSLRRDDTGPGACEVVLVEAFSIL
ncbi:MAG: hypothetical protein WBM52_20795 [Thiogranum sp.]